MPPQKKEKPTLLELATRGAAKTSEDIPQLKGVLENAWEKEVAKQEAQRSKVVFPAGKNIFGYDTAPVTMEDLPYQAMGIAGAGPNIAKLAKRVGPRLLGMYKKLIGQTGKKALTEPAIPQSPGGSLVKTVIAKPKKGMEIKHDPYKDLTLGRADKMSTNKLSEALDIPQNARGNVTKEELMHLVRLRTRDKTMMHVTENPQVPVLDMDYKTNIMHSAPGVANIQDMGSGLRAMSRIAAQHPESKWRVYSTPGGIRSFNISQRGRPQDVKHYLDYPEVDQWYKAHTYNRGSFATRITPKMERKLGEDFIAQPIITLGTGKTNARSIAQIQQTHDIPIAQYISKYGLEDTKGLASGLIKNIEAQSGSLSPEHLAQIIKNLRLAAVPAAISQKDSKNR